MDNEIKYSLNMQPFKKEYENLDHKEQVFEKIEKLWRIGQCSDIIIEVEGIEFYCHRIILISISQYFACIVKYFRFHPGSNQIVNLKLPFIDANIFDLILEYIYTGHITANHDNLSCLIYTADYFLLDTMLESLSRILGQYLTVDNVIDYYHLVYQINNEVLTSVIMKFIIRNIYKLYITKKLDSLSFDVILNIIKDKRIIIRENSVLYFGAYFIRRLKEIISYWITSDIKSRKDSEHILMDCIERRIIRSLCDKSILKTYRYIEPIPRAYFLNSNPFGQHPPSLVYPPYNFRCLGKIIRRTFIDHPPHKWFVKKIIIYLIPDWNNVIAVADVQIDYKHYWSGEVQKFKTVIDNYCSYLKEEISLDDNERIIKLDIYHGWMIYGLTFYTSNNRILGVFGSKNGVQTKLDFQKDHSNAIYLHGFAFISIYSKNWRAINWLTVYGSMIDKDNYFEDFQIAFEADQEYSTDEIDEEIKSIPSYISCNSQLENEKYVKNMTYTPPHSIEDLFYQWKRYMRIMRSSFIKNNSSLPYKETLTTSFPTSMPMLSIQRSLGN